VQICEEKVHGKMSGLGKNEGLEKKGFMGKTKV
jgi:hypothetical protein